MKALPRVTLIAACLLFMSGCASVDVTKTASDYYAPTDPNLIEILKTQPERKFVELGTITVSGFDSKEVAKMHNGVRAKAAPLGANAVILTEEGLIPTGFGQYKRWATGVAIRYE